MSEVGTALTDTVKGSMRISSKSAVVENDINNTIAAAKMDLKAAGVKKIDETDPLIIRAVVTFCRANFGSPADYDKMKTSYDEQKAMMQMATGYTEWGDKI